MDNKIYFIVPIVVLVIAIIVMAFIPSHKDNTEEPPIEEGSDIGGGGDEPIIPPITIPTDKDGNTGDTDSTESGGELESDEPPIGKDNVDLDVSENTPPEKNPDPTASASDVIYGTKGEGDGE